MTRTSLISSPSRGAALTCALQSLAVAGCSHRLVTTRAPYVISDQVFVADRQFLLEEEGTIGDEKIECTEFRIVFVPGPSQLRDLTYELTEQKPDGGYEKVAFKYALRPLALPQAEDEALGNAVVDVRVQAKQADKGTVRQAAEVERPAKTARAAWCTLQAEDGELKFGGGFSFLGEHPFGLVAEHDGFRTGRKYRLEFYRGPNEPDARTEASTLHQGGDGVNPELRIGQAEIRMVEGNNWVGAPVGLGLVFGFLVLTTL